MQLLYASVNKEEIGYLIHGQPFFFEYGIEGAKFVLIDYKLQMRGRWWKRFRIGKPEGTFSSVTNAYKPEIRILAFKSYYQLWPKIFRFPLKINFFNTIQYQPQLRIPRPATGGNRLNLTAESRPYRHGFSEPKTTILHCNLNPQNIFINKNLIQYP